MSYYILQVALTLAAGLNWLNAATWFAFWLSLSDRFWQASFLILGFAVVATGLTVAAIARRRSETHRRIPAPLILLCFVFPLLNAVCAPRRARMMNPTADWRPRRTGVPQRP